MFRGLAAVAVAAGVVGFAVPAGATSFPDGVSVGQVGCGTQAWDSHGRVCLAVTYTAAHPRGGYVVKESTDGGGWRTVYSGSHAAVLLHRAAFHDYAWRVSNNGVTVASTVWRPVVRKASSTTIKHSGDVSSITGVMADSVWVRPANRFDSRSEQFWLESPSTTHTASTSGDVAGVDLLVDLG